MPDFFNIYSHFIPGKLHVNEELFHMTESEYRTNLLKVRVISPFLIIFILNGLLNVVKFGGYEKLLLVIGVIGIVYVLYAYLPGAEDMKKYRRK